jgi:hypothetical protein
VIEAVLYLDVLLVLFDVARSGNALSSLDILLHPEQGAHRSVCNELKSTLAVIEKEVFVERLILLDTCALVDIAHVFEEPRLDGRLALTPIADANCEVRLFGVGPPVYEENEQLLLQNLLQPLRDRRSEGTADDFAQQMP